MMSQNRQIYAPNVNTYTKRQITLELSKAKHSWWD